MEEKGKVNILNFVEAFLQNLSLKFAVYLKIGNYHPYDDGLKMDIFIKDASGRPFIGKVWNPNSTVWPDFSHPNITQYWLYQLDAFRKIVPFDGAWIVRNFRLSKYNAYRLLF